MPGSAIRCVLTARDTGARLTEVRELAPAVDDGAVRIDRMQLGAARDRLADAVHLCGGGVFTDDGVSHLRIRMRNGADQHERHLRRCDGVRVGRARGRRVCLTEQVGIHDGADVHLGLRGDACVDRGGRCRRLWIAGA